MNELLTEYQNKFAHYVHAKGARATSLGRHSLVVLLKAIGVQPGDNIGVCAFTCFSVIEAVLVAGGEPVYLDVDESLCIDPDQILKYPPDYLKAVILQHTFGNPGRLDQLLNACNQIHAHVIEDCAHALGCYWNGRPLGQFGEGAIYSFQWGKPYTTGQGGMVTFNSLELVDKADKIIEKWAVPQTIKVAVLLGVQRNIYSLFSKSGLIFYLRSLYKGLRSKFLYDKSIESNYNFKFDYGYIKIPDMLTAREGLKKITAYSEKIDERRKTVDAIEKSLKRRNIPLCKCENKTEITMIRYPLFIENKKEVLMRASQRHLDIAGWYESPVHPLKNDDLLKVGYVENTAQNAEKYIKKLVHLPTNNPNDDIELMLDTIFNE